jgi:hypothetical protein
LRAEAAPVRRRFAELDTILASQDKRAEKEIDAVREAVELDLRALGLRVGGTTAALAGGVIGAVLSPVAVPLLAGLAVIGGAAALQPDVRALLRTRLRRSSRWVLADLAKQAAAVGAELPKVGTLWRLTANELDHHDELLRRVSDLGLT